MSKLRLGRIYPITHATNLNRLTHEELASRYLAGGAKFLQVRENALCDRLLLRQLQKIRALCASREAGFVVNNRVDLALAAGADGVHLGQSDLPVSVARRLLGSEAIIGLSTHNEQEFRQAQEEEVDYLAIGPVFATGTKQTDNPPVGLSLVSRLAASSKCPVVAIGGISLERAVEAWRAGAHSVAVISDLADHPDPEGRVREYLKATSRG